MNRRIGRRPGGEFKLQILASVLRREEYLGILMRSSGDLRAGLFGFYLRLNNLLVNYEAFPPGEMVDCFTGYILRIIPRFQ